MIKLNYNLALSNVRFLLKSLTPEEYESVLILEGVKPTKNMLMNAKAIVTLHLEEKLTDLLLFDSIVGILNSYKNGTAGEDIIFDKTNNLFLTCFDGLKGVRAGKGIINDDGTIVTLKYEELRARLYDIAGFHYQPHAFMSFLKKDKISDPLAREKLKESQFNSIADFYNFLDKPYFIDMYDMGKLDEKDKKDFLKDSFNKFKVVKLIRNADIPERTFFEETKSSPLKM